MNWPNYFHSNFTYTYNAEISIFALHDHVKSFLFKLEAISINVFYVEAAEQITFVLARMKRLVERDSCLTVRAKFPCC